MICDCLRTGGRGYLCTCLQARGWCWLSRFSDFELPKLRIHSSAWIHSLVREKHAFLECNVVFVRRSPYGVGQHREFECFVSVLHRIIHRTDVDGENFFAWCTALNLYIWWELRPVDNVIDCIKWNGFWRECIQRFGLLVIINSMGFVEIAPFGVCEITFQSVPIDTVITAENIIRKRRFMSVVTRRITVESNLFRVRGLVEMQIITLTFNSPYNIIKWRETEEEKGFKYCLSLIFYSVIR